MDISLQIAPWLILLISLLTAVMAGGTIGGEYIQAKKRKSRKAGDPGYKRISRVAFLIASKDGEKTIVKTVNAALKNRCDVYVISDGSLDNTAKEAKAAGAKVLNLRKNIGKPSALYRGYKHFKLAENYDAVAILDDDVAVERDFIAKIKKVMARDVAIAVGKNLTDWPPSHRWNIWLATRAYSYWSYQAILRRIQSAYNVMNCISGSNSVYRVEVLNQVLRSDTPYIVDDTFWTLETHRLKLGRIVYAPKARAWIQDPTNFGDWYKQNLRWMWGTFQGIIGHRLGTKLDKFHLAYLLLMAEWLVYILSVPALLFIIWRTGIASLPLEFSFLLLGYGVWVSAAAVALKRPVLVLFTPAILVIDIIYRALMVHSLIKAIKQPTVANCVWESPRRFDARPTTITS